MLAKAPAIPVIGGFDETDVAMETVRVGFGNAADGDHVVAGADLYCSFAVGLCTDTAAHVALVFGPRVWQLEGVVGRCTHASTWACPRPRGGPTGTAGMLTAEGHAWKEVVQGSAGHGLPRVPGVRLDCRGVSGLG